MKCPECGQEVEYHRPTCRFCGAPLGYPNVRRAQSMRADLDSNYTAAVADAERRGVKSLLDSLQDLLSRSVATINVNANILLSMTLGAPLRSYHNALDADLRKVAEEIYHRHRTVVDAAVHPGYHEDITYAAVSPDGRGLINYGEVTLQIDERFIAQRTSVLRENSFRFYERYDLGRRDAIEPPGWRCVWADRDVLGATHFEPELTVSLSGGTLADLVLRVSADKDADSFMEVHIFGSLPIETVRTVSLDRPLSTADSRHAWGLARQKVAAQGIPIEDRTSP